MLDQIFIQVVKMSYTASFVIPFILLARIALRKLPKRFSYALWSVTLFRLICPWSFESAFSLLAIERNTTAYVAPLPAVQSAWTAVSSSLPLTEQEFILPAAQAPLSESLPGGFFSLFWLMGVAILLIYSAVTLVRLQRQLKDAVYEGENIYCLAQLPTPFVLGLIHPRIYLPDSLSPDEKTYILLHEQIHIRRFDHIIKVISFFILCLHWFNPLVWLAFFLSGKDMEMSCDEAVIRQLGNEVKKPYSSSLLNLSTRQATIGATPLAFGEGDTKSRIKNVLHYQKPAFWVMMAGLILVVAVGIGLAANPKAVMDSGAHSTTQSVQKQLTSQSQFPDPLEKAVSQAILSHYGDSNPVGSSTEPADIICESHVTLAKLGDGPTKNNVKSSSITVYTMVLYQKYRYVDDGLKEIGGNHGPAAITFDLDESGVYTLAEYWVPRDGSYYGPDIKEKFPSSTWADATDTQKYILPQIQDNYAQAIAYKNFNTAPIIEKKFASLCLASSFAAQAPVVIPADHQDYRELTYYGDYTLQYIFSAFIKGGQNDTKAQVMCAVMKDLIGDEAITMTTTNSQEYFDAWLAQGQQKLIAMGEEAMLNKYPKTYLLLTMLPEHQSSTLHDK